MAPVFFGMLMAFDKPEVAIIKKFKVFIGGDECDLIKSLLLISFTKRIKKSRFDKKPKRPLLSSN